MIDFLLDAFGTDWSRVWVRLRAALVLVLVLCFPLTFKHLLDWYGHHRAQEIVRILVPSPAVTAPPR